MHEVRDRRHASWFWMDKNILDTHGPRIGAYGVAVYALLARYADGKEQAFPSLNTLAKTLNMSRTTVVKALISLENSALIGREKRIASAGDADTTVYTLLPVGGVVHHMDNVVHHMDNGCPCGEQRVVHHMDNGCSPGGQEQELINKNYLEQELLNKKNMLPSEASPLAALTNRFSGGQNTNGSEQPRQTPASLTDRKPARQREKFGPQELLALYNELIPYGHPTIRRITEKRLTRARVYLKQFPTRDFWEQVFAEIHQSQFLQGNVKRPGHENFIADFDWLLTCGKDGIENCVKVAEGKFNDNKSRRTGMVQYQGSGPHSGHQVYLAGDAPLCVTCQSPLPEDPEYAEVYAQFRDYQSYIIRLGGVPVPHVQVP